MKKILFLTMGFACIFYNCRRPSSVGYSGPSLEIIWENPGNSKVYTGERIMKIKIRSYSELHPGDSLRLYFRDGYTMKRTYMPTVHIEKKQRLDTVFTFITKKKINAFYDKYINVSAKTTYRTATEKFDLGMSLLALFNSGRCTYIDGRGNSYHFGSNIWQFKPILPEKSSTGIDHGYVNQEISPTALQRDSVYECLRVLVNDTASHTRTKILGTGLLMLKNGAYWKQDYLISNSSGKKGEFENYLSKDLFK